LHHTRFYSTGVTKVEVTHYAKLAIVWKL